MVTWPDLLHAGVFHCDFMKSILEVKVNNPHAFLHAWPIQSLKNDVSTLCAWYSDERLKFEGRFSKYNSSGQLWVMRAWEAMVAGSNQGKNQSRLCWSEFVIVIFLRSYIYAIGNHSKTVACNRLCGDFECIVILHTYNKPKSNNVVWGA